MTRENPPTAILTPAEGQCLVRLARATIAEQLKSPIDSDDLRSIKMALQATVFRARCGVFVTLSLEGTLRGCIGSLTASEPLAETVRRTAVNAAFHDPRFPPLDRGELDRIAIEVSVLSPPAALSYDDADDLMLRLRPGIDGVILRKGSASATFLPQVWKQLPRCQDFLSHLCLKAGLSARAWYDGNLQVETYQVQSFEEGR